MKIICSVNEAKFYWLWNLHLYQGPREEDTDTWMRLNCDVLIGLPHPDGLFGSMGLVYNSIVPAEKRFRVPENEQKPVIAEAIHKHGAGMREQVLRKMFKTGEYPKGLRTVDDLQKHAPAMLRQLFENNDDVVGDSVWDLTSTFALPCRAAEVMTACEIPIQEEDPYADRLQH